MKKKEFSERIVGNGETGLLIWVRSVSILFLLCYLLMVKRAESEVALGRLGMEDIKGKGGCWSMTGGDRVVYGSKGKGGDGGSVVWKSLGI